MSVAAMTMDDNNKQFMNNYDKMSKQYEQTLHSGGGVGGSAMTGGAPLSGPASPTPSGSEEPTSHNHHHQFPHMPHQQHHHQHHHHHHQQFHHHQQDQQQQQTSPLQQQQLQQPISANAEAVAAAEQRQRLLEEEIDRLKLEQVRLLQQSVDAQRREKILMRRLANKEQEFQDYVSQIAEYKAAQAPSAMALRSALLDPAVNLLFEKLKKELKATKAKLEETQNELSAWKFTPDSNTGKRLMAKCRLLYQENEELGKMTSNGRLAKLETELAMQKSFCEEVKKSQSELDDFVQELDEDVEGMQSTILYLQQELKNTRDRIQVLEKENFQLKHVNSVEVAKNAEMESALNVPHLGLNGTGAVHNANELAAAAVAYNAAKLETIDENSCLRIHANASTEFYNGTIEPQATASILASVSAIGDEGSNSSTGRFRTAATRKRNYDSDSNETTSLLPTNLSTTPINATLTMPAVYATNVPVSVSYVPPQTFAPRCTLPPKKSKLRVTSPVMHIAEPHDMDVNTLGDSIAPVAIGMGMGVLSQEPLLIDDNSMPTNLVIKDEPLNAMNAENNADAGGVAQRIMTRRRSVRNQQNGNGGDTNH